MGNPPYVRQEWISPIKPYLQQHYQALPRHGRPLRLLLRTGPAVLKPGGRLSLVVTNKWLKAGYGEPLRQFFGRACLGRVGRGFRARQADFRGRRRLPLHPGRPEARRRTSHRRRCVSARSRGSSFASTTWASRSRIRGVDVDPRCASVPVPGRSSQPRDQTYWRKFGAGKPLKEFIGAESV